MRATQCSSTGTAWAESTSTRSPRHALDARVQRLRVVEVVGAHSMDPGAVRARDLERRVGGPAVHHEHVEIEAERCRPSVSRQVPISSASLSVRMTTPMSLAHRVQRTRIQRSADRGAEPSRKAMDPWPGPRF